MCLVKGERRGAQAPRRSPFIFFGASGSGAYGHRRAQRRDNAVLLHQRQAQRALSRPQPARPAGGRETWYNRATMFTILKSKLRPPAVRWAVVERATLLLRLDAAAADPTLQMLLLTAAAGYSKTTVLADWVRRLHRRGVPVAWYSLGPGDRALPIFCTYLTAALREAVPGFGAIYDQ